MKRCCLCVMAAMILASALSFAQQSANAGSSSTQDTPKTTPERPQRVRVSPGVASGLLISKVQPQYPEAARQARVQGQVILKALIDKEGSVQDLELVSGHELLAPAAIEAVKQWKYKPYLLNGQPVNVETQILVNFALSKH